MPGNVPGARDAVPRLRSARARSTWTARRRSGTSGAARATATTSGRPASAQLLAALAPSGVAHRRRSVVRRVTSAVGGTLRTSLDARRVGEHAGADRRRDGDRRVGRSRAAAHRRTAARLPDALAEVVGAVQGRDRHGVRVRLLNWNRSDPHREVPGDLVDRLTYWRREHQHRRGRQEHVRGRSTCNRARPASVGRARRRATAARPALAALGVQPRMRPRLPGDRRARRPVVDLWRDRRRRRVARCPRTGRCGCSSGVRAPARCGWRTGSTGSTRSSTIVASAR